MAPPSRKGAWAYFRLVVPRKLPAIESSVVGDVTIKTIVLVCVSALVLVGYACENNTPTPVADASAPPAQGVGVGEPNPATPPGADAAPTPPPADPNKPPVDGAATLTSPATAVVGANVAVAWTGPNNSGDYIDIVPRGAAATSGEITYAYVRSSKNGSVIVRAPTSAGDYDIRYVQDLAGPRTVKATASLTVTAAAATLTAPATAETGQVLSIVWTGPNGPGDYIDIVKGGQTTTGSEITYAYTDRGSPATLEAPSASGT